MLRTLGTVVVMAALSFASAAGCDGCAGRARRHEVEMCGKCVFSSECRVGLACVNATCETVPPSCHVKIGL